MKIVVNDWIPSDGTMYQFAEPTGMPFSLAYGEGVAQVGDASVPEVGAWDQWRTDIHVTHVPSFYPGQQSNDNHEAVAGAFR